MRMRAAHACVLQGFVAPLGASWHSATTYGRESPRPPTPMSNYTSVWSGLLSSDCKILHLVELAFGQFFF